MQLLAFTNLTRNDEDASLIPRVDSDGSRIEYYYLVTRMAKRVPQDERETIRGNFFDELKQCKKIIGINQAVLWSENFLWSYPLFQAYQVEQEVSEELFQNLNEEQNFVLVKAKISYRKAKYVQLFPEKDYLNREAVRGFNRKIKEIQDKDRQSITSLRADIPLELTETLNGEGSLMYFPFPLIREVKNGLDMFYTPGHGSPKILGTDGEFWDDYETYVEDVAPAVRFFDFPRRLELKKPDEQAISMDIGRKQAKARVRVRVRNDDDSSSSDLSDDEGDNQRVYWLKVLLKGEDFEKVKDDQWYRVPQENALKNW